MEISWIPKYQTSYERRKIKQKLKRECSRLLTLPLEMYENEVTDAYECVCKVLFEGVTSILFALLPQSGKTKTATAFFMLLRIAVPRLQAYYFCANNEKSLRKQILDTIDNVPQIHYLTLQDRNNIIQTNQKIPTPLVIFFDENHFGDGTLQSVHLFLIYVNYFKNISYIKNPHSNILFVGLSATGFSSLNFFDFVHKRSLDVLHKSGYNSCTMMLSKNKIKECDVFIDKNLKIIWDSNVFKKLNECVKKHQGCYGIIRCNSVQAKAIEKTLNKKYGEKIKIKHWNQKNDMNPKEYFKRKRMGFTLVLIQNMARMGSNIPTEHIRFMACYYSNYSTLATVIQAEVARCAGYPKQNHDVTIFTSLKHATAYSLFEQDKDNLFNLTLRVNKIKPSARSSVSLVEDPSNFERENRYLPIDFKRPMRDQINEIKESLLSEFGDVLKGEIRVRSRHSKDRTKQKGMWDFGNNTDTLAIGKKIGMMAAAILDYYSDERITRSSKILVKIIKRVKAPSNVQTLIEPKETSIYHI